MKKRLILASSSPRRIELLKNLGLEFEIIPSHYDEDMSLDLEPLELAKYLSFGKAQDVASRIDDGVIIGADTFVIINGKILGKPGNNENARKMLKEINGKRISVISGYTIIDIKNNKKISNSREDFVYIKNMTQEEINNYVKTGEPLDKAGAFAIQGFGALIVEKIEGNYHSIIGLPLFSLFEDLKDFGINIL
ncbi:MAG: Maf family protein [Candidatus Gracilibacteria bacterium]|nr:Maf family protein [Candidatus Gracilibacteria bacterium]MDD4530697.1 Maf family protein [Candidatus Gracilibacteria bacterium]